jgi:hypothetical protein
MIGATNSGRRISPLPSHTANVSNATSASTAVAQTPTIARAIAGRSRDRVSKTFT